MAFFIAQSEILTTTIGLYVVKFILIPSALAALCLLTSYFTVHGKKASRKAKIYTVSLMISSGQLHLFYGALRVYHDYALYVIAIFLTTTYADYKLTSLVSVLTFISFILSELFLQWDADKVSIWDSATRLFEFLVALSVIVGSAIVCSVAIHYEREKTRQA